MKNLLNHLAAWVRRPFDRLRERNARIVDEREARRNG